MKHILSLKLNEEEKALISSLKIEFKHVYIHKKGNILEIIYKANRPLIEEEYNLLDRLYSEKFKNYNVEVIIEIFDYRLDKLYSERIIQIIKKKVSSCKGWIDKLSMEIENNNIFISVPSEMAKVMLQRNGLIKDLEETTNKETNCKCNISIHVSEEEIDYNYIENKSNEELEYVARKIAEKTNNEKKINRKTNSESNIEYIYGKDPGSELLKILDIKDLMSNIKISGMVFDVEYRQLKNKSYIFTFNITDKSDSFICKAFIREKDFVDLSNNLNDGDYCSVAGDVVYDEFLKTNVLMFKYLKTYEPEIKRDLEEVKRVELHLHSKMSSMDGIASISEIIDRAEKWGHKAVAITDHGVVQAFPEAMKASKGKNLKVIYGMEGYLVLDDKKIVENYHQEKEDEIYVVFDIETTGLSAINDKITEIGAVKIKNGEIIDEFASLVNPERLIPEKIVKLTGITDEMVKDKPTINTIIREFKDFVSDSILVAHNASFDIGFIRENYKLIDENLDNPILDTLELSRAVFPDLKNHRLNTLTKHLDIKLENHHRAVDDAKATSEVFMKIVDILKERGIEDINQLNKINLDRDHFKDRPYHVVILVKNLKGLKNLYEIVSKSHMDYFYREPRIPKSLLEDKREGLLIGSACSSGELFDSILSNKSEEEIDEIVKFYDYLEIQPLENNKYLIDKGIIKDYDQLKIINKKIYDLAIKHNKLAVATGDVHFLDPEDEVYRRIIMSGQGFSSDDQPPLYFKTTEEMLEDFKYFGEEVARELVIENSNLISEKIDKIIPIPEGTFPPIIEGSDNDLRNICYERAYEMYGNPLPEIVEKRLEKELGSIIKNGYAVMYIIAEKLVKKSIEDGYLVGSRGSVGSSFAATMSGITEVNPLPAHYLCPKCKYSKFYTKGEYNSGADLEDATCPICSSKLIKDGHDIPFEVFLGFDGDKEPDIDLNFASEYQSEAHRYTEELFGEGYVFRAGTIGTIAERTAFGFVKKYYESQGEYVRPVEINRLVKGLTGIRRTSGQHPGGVMIVPHYKDIHDFSPIQYPANDKKSGVITTHFDYDSIQSNILKLDILGHDVPTMIKNLEDLTGIVSTEIPLDEPKTMSIFRDLKELKVDKELYNSKIGSLGIPEFGTRFVRQMLMDTKPETFSDLVRISGLSHGTDVWLNNAQDLIRQKIVGISEVIATREDIMIQLINYGMDKSLAFKIMESVRKGRGLTEEEESIMRSLGVKDWYIDSCKKIKYMFPKAHAVAYVMMSFRIAFFKVYYPEAFYTTYFSTKVNDFDTDLIVCGREKIVDEMRRIDSLGRDATAKELNLLTVLEVAEEMYARGISISKVDLYESDSDQFILTSDKKILPPLKTLDGLGESAARQIKIEREKGDFISKEDLIKRCGIGKSTIEVLNSHGCLDLMPDSNQLSLF